MEFQQIHVLIIVYHYAVEDIMILEVVNRV